MNVEARNAVACHEVICQRILRIAEVYPEFTAICSDDISLTFKELLTRSLSLAHVLQARIGDTGAVVAILGQRRVETPLAMVACLFAGIPFLVIDASYPQRRVMDIWQLSNCAALLHCEHGASGYLADIAEGIASERLIAIDHDWPPRTDLPQRFRNEAAYLLLTSGTTGHPKGIRVGEAPLVHFVDWYAATFQVKPRSRFVMLSGLSHDPVMRDIFVPLMTGGELHIPRQDIVLKPDLLRGWISQQRIQYAHMTPQMVALLSTARKETTELDGLEYVFCGGDVLQQSCVTQVASMAPNATLVNFYGTSETPQAMAYQVISEDLEAPYPLGMPIDDVQIHIVDEQKRLLPAGERGEIVIETRFLSLGYVPHSHALAQPENSPAFLPGIASVDPEVRCYRTGDLGFKDTLGQLHFCGRSDDQVKVRGYRVNCREVAETLERHGLAKNALVLPEHDENGQVSLVAYIVNGERPSDRNSMAEWLPAYMVPGEIVHVDQMPLMANGKVDRAALRSMRKSAAHEVAKDSHSALTVALLEILRRPSANPKETFVDLGGDSLSFITASLTIEDHLGFLPDNWENMSIESIGALRKQRPPQPGYLPQWLGMHKIELSVALRSLSIITIVLSHAGAVFSSGSPVLFVISGISFARFRLSGVIDKLEVGPILNLVLKYGIPAGLWQIFRSFYLNEKLWIPDVFLMGTLWQRVPVGHFTFWFLDILTACILLLTGLALVFGYARRLMATQRSLSDTMMPFSFAVLAIALVLFGVQVYTGSWDGELGVASTGPFRWFWVFVLGVCVQAASKKYQKWAVVGIFAGTLAVVGLLGRDQTTWSVFFVASVVALLFVKSIAIPRIAAKVIAIIASNSLYIYIVNASVISHVLPKLGIEHSPVVSLSMSLAVGIGVGIAWEKLAAITAKAIRSFKHGRRPLHQDGAVANSAGELKRTFSL